MLYSSCLIKVSFHSVRAFTITGTIRVYQLVLFWRLIKKPNLIQDLLLWPKLFYNLQNDSNVLYKEAIKKRTSSKEIKIHELDVKVLVTCCYIDMYPYVSLTQQAFVSLQHIFSVSRLQHIFRFEDVFKTSRNTS